MVFNDLYNSTVGSKYAVIPTIWWTIMYIIMIVCTWLN